MKKTIQKIAYEKYQLDWMMQHGYSLQDVFEVLKEGYIKSCESGDIDGGTSCDADLEALEVYFDEYGFGGEMYVCYDEFLYAEYTDVKYMRCLLTKKEFLEYLKENFSAYDYFEVSEDGVVKISEYGYVSDGSVTDNPQETSRLVECSGAEFKQSDLARDEDANYMINAVLEDAKQYIGDITDERFYERIYELLEDAEEANYYLSKDLKPGKYISCYLN